MENYALQQLGPSFTETLLIVATTYFLIASISSYIVEYVGACLNMRGKGLQFLLVELMQGSLNDKGGFLGLFRKYSSIFGLFVQGVKIDRASLFAQSFMQHDLVKSLEQPRLFLRSKTIFPSYIPSHTFAMALFDNILNRRSQFPPVPYSLDLDALVAGASTSQIVSDKLRDWFDTLKAKLQVALASPGGAPSGCKTAYDTLLSALTAILSDTKEREVLDPLLDLNEAEDPPSIAWLPTSNTPAPEAARMIARVLLGGPDGPLSKLPASIIERLPLSVSNLRSALYDAGVPPVLRNSLLPLIDAAQSDLDDLTKRVQTWFDDSMNRATGWYKRQVQLFLFVIGALFVFLFNIDSITLVQQLSANPVLTAELTPQATGIIGASGNFVQSIALVRAADIVCGSDPVAGKPMASCSATADQAVRLLPLLLKDPAYLPIADAGRSKADYASLYADIHGVCEKASPGALKDECDTVKQASGTFDGVAARDALLAKFYSYPATADVILAAKDQVQIDAEIKNSRNIADRQSTDTRSFLSSLPGVGWLGISWKDATSSASAMLEKIIGLALSAALVSLGAQEFELSGNIRSVGQRDRSPVARFSVLLPRQDQEPDGGTEALGGAGRAAGRSG